MYNVKHRLFMSGFERFLMRSEDFTKVPSGVRLQDWKEEFDRCEVAKRVFSYSFWFLACSKSSDSLEGGEVKDDAKKMKTKKRMREERITTLPSLPLFFLICFTSRRSHLSAERREEAI